MCLLLYVCFVHVSYIPFCFAFEDAEQVYLALRHVRHEASDAQALESGERRCTYTSKGRKRQGQVLMVKRADPSVMVKWKSC